MPRIFYETENRFARDVAASTQRHLSEAEAHFRAGRKHETLAILIQYLEWRLKGATEPCDGTDLKAIRLMQDIQGSCTPPVRPE